MGSSLFPAATAPARELRRSPRACATPTTPRRVAEAVALHRSARSLVALALLATLPAARAQVANGFDLTGAIIPEREIIAGGPPRDGILALTDPPRTTANHADGWLAAGDRVIGLAVGRQAVAYPIRILNWHELINDVVGGRPVAVSYCPLCRTGVVFDAGIDGHRAVFGVSGLLYKSDVLLYERATDSLFSQLLFKGVSGALRGRDLQTLPASTTTWEVWRRRHPETEVVSRALPYGLDYGTDPYDWYHRSRKSMFPVRDADRSHPAKDWAFLVLNGKRKLLAAEGILRGMEDRSAALYRGPHGFELRYDPHSRELTAHGGGGEATVIAGYWFALSAFHPDARVVVAGDLEVAEGAD